MAAPTLLKTNLFQLDELKEIFLGIDLPDPFTFGQVIGANGRDCFLSEDQYSKWQIKHGPKPPRIQFYLKRAANYRQRLDETPGLTQSTLAKEIGLSRYELIHNLNLLKLASDIRKFLLSLEPSHREYPITKKSLQRISTIKDPAEQKQQFNELVTSVVQ